MATVRGRLADRERVPARVHREPRGAGVGGVGGVRGEGEGSDAAARGAAGRGGGGAHAARARVLGGGRELHAVAAGVRGRRRALAHRALQGDWRAQPRRGRRAHPAHAAVRCARPALRARLLVPTGQRRHVHPRRNAVRHELLIPRRECCGLLFYRHSRATTRASLPRFGRAE